MRTIIISLIIIVFAFSARAQVELHPAFPGIEPFRSPVAIVSSYDSSDRIFVVEKEGAIYVITHPDSVSATKKIFLDLRSVATHLGSEDGLLGLAFHPQFKENGELFVCYTHIVDSIFEIRISLFSAEFPLLDTVETSSEIPIYSIHPPDIVHHGGSLLFGPLGNLFCGIGDCTFTGGTSGDFWRLAQNYRSPEGKLLRFDINTRDSVHNFSIPQDNPFAADSTNILKEIYAAGFRNPWKFTFDDSTGNLWLADVGHVSYEEIDLVTPGGNYGWSILEGNHRFNDSTVDTAGMIPPLFEYPHTDGNGCITGGYVYHGVMIPELQGKYIYGDFLSGRIWAFTYSNAGTFSNELLIDHGNPSIYLSSFGRDAAGEILVADYLSGIIYRLTPPLGKVAGSEGKPIMRLSIQRTIFTNSILSTGLTIELPEAGVAEVSLLDQKGQEILPLLSKSLSVGRNSVEISIPSHLSSGIYFLRLKAVGCVMTQKIIIDK